MAETVLAGVAVQNLSYSVDKLYTYVVGPKFADTLQVGCRVMVPFGRGNAWRQGIVLSLHRAEQAEDYMKEIAAVLDQAPLLDVKRLSLVTYLKERTFCTLFDAVRVMFPPGINLKTRVAYALKQFPDPEAEPQLTADQMQILEYLRHRKGYVKKTAICADLGLDSSSEVLEQLYKANYLLRDYDAIRSVGDAAVRMIRLADAYQTEEALEQYPEKLTAKQKAVVEELQRCGACSVKELCYFTGVTEAVPKALVKKGLAVTYDKEVYRRPYEKDVTDTTPICLTEEQQTAFEGLLQKSQQGGGAALLYGVTGSGKTQVYLKLIDALLPTGKGILVMVPEISLTPQTLHLFYSRYGNKVAVFHSALSQGERLDEWKRVNQGEAQIVVGTRSAVFAPFPELSLIIMDEEQEHTYQSEQSPRYHARDVAKFRCAQDKALLVLASATPSFESYTAALSGRYDYYELKNRYGTAKLPEVTVVDLCKERRNGNTSQISKVLYTALAENLKESRQSILLLNRRGYQTFAECTSCGAVATCPNCSISLTYHQANRRLMCHYCGYSVPFTNHCSSCGQDEVRYTGSGTQKVEEELQELFPTASLLRMDTDTTMQKYAYDEKWAAFQQGKYDIMIGTQMVAKGLDFEKVTLVGVLNADKELYNDDYKSLERTFDLITQVVGRAGRGQYAGKAIIQTLNPENEVIQLAAKQDYQAFYQTEIAIRKAMAYPPFCTLVSVGFQGKQAETVQHASAFFLQLLKEKTEAFPEVKLIALGPMEERVFKLNGKYRYRLLIKCKNNRMFRNLLSALLLDFSKDRKSNGIQTIVSVES